jgi:Fe-S-cluster containining protein
MKEVLGLWPHCKECGFKCCSNTTGSSPRLNEDERERIEANRGLEHLKKEYNYWVINHDSRGCAYLTKEGRCWIHDIKPVDCLIFPLDPVYTENGEVYWIMVENCPAVRYLTPEFVAKAIFLGTEWVLRTDRESFDQYWKKHKLSNTKQNLVRIEQFLSSKPKGFSNEIKRELEKIIGEDLLGWMERNKSSSLKFLLAATEQ